MSILEHFDSLKERTIDRFIRRVSEGYGDRVAVHDLPTGEKITYNALYERSSRYARILATMGVNSNDHVAIQCQNTPDALYLLLAVAIRGAVAVPLSQSIKGNLLSDFLERADCTVLIHDVEHRTEPSINVASYHIGYINNSDASDAEVSNDHLNQFNATAMLMFTSGTTGPAKANIFTHCHAVSYALEQARAYKYQPEDVVYTCLPLCHTNGLLSHVYAAFAVGARVVLSKKFSASRFWTEINQSGSTVTGLLGSMCDFVWSHRFEPHAVNQSLKRVVVIPVPTYVREFIDKFGVEIFSSYGLTDYALAAIFDDVSPESKLGSAGKSRPGIDIRIADDDGLEVPAGRSGEILLRSRNPWQSASGYYGMPIETLAARQDLWFHTGDLGYIDDDGYLFFLGRSKDAIRRRGENVSAYEVERAFLRVSGVENVAVFGVKSEYSEEEIAAWIIPSNAEVFDVELALKVLRENLADFMVPRFLHFSSEFPMTHTQKVDKKKLVQHFIENAHAYTDTQAEIDSYTRRKKR